MIRSSKRIALIYLSVTLTSLVLLASSLSNLQLHAGNPFPGAATSADTLQHITALPTVKTYSIPLLRGIFALIFLALMIYVPARFIALANLKRILPLLLALILLFIVLSVIPLITPTESSSPSVGISVATSPPSFKVPTSSLGKPPQEIVWFVLLGFMLGIGFLVFWVWKQKLFLNHSEVQLLKGLEDAVDALNTGRDFSSVIIQCYFQMTEILKDERGIERNFNMTAREFEDWLALKGIPRSPIRQLTYLFEKVRYGRQELSKEDEKTGVDCLNEIIRYCRKEEAPIA